ncbi:hypothetical protein KFK09_021076 [Dendrobium nobile]|uniref:Uncharacterized protein n=1 Tax=Dendrobium nobile TaxID=94219 RepID=A0A8T3AP75_DENNO|nr:hypothetical protein KFK09_021076 [Dendrobium nobile]
MENLGNADEFDLRSYMFGVVAMSEYLLRGFLFFSPLLGFGFFGQGLSLTAEQQAYHSQELRPAKASSSSSMLGLSFFFTSIFDVANQRKNWIY